jgi:hypothetical protein
VESLVFLSELMIDFGPYFFVNTGEPVELRTGTSIRQRVLQARNALPEGYLSPMCTVTEGQTSVELFQWLFPRPSLITQAYMLLSRAIFSRDQRMHATPVQVLWGMLSIVMHWRGDILNVRARNLVDLAVKKMSAGIPVSRVIELIPELKNLPTDFPFLGGIQSCVLEELLEMLYLSKKIPRYYLRQNRSEYDAQFERRNPRFAEKQAAMLANGREI